MLFVLIQGPPALGSVFGFGGAQRGFRALLRVDLVTAFMTTVNCCCIFNMIKFSPGKSRCLQPRSIGLPRRSGPRPLTLGRARDLLTGALFFGLQGFRGRFHCRGADILFRYIDLNTLKRSLAEPLSGPATINLLQTPRSGPGIGPRVWTRSAAADIFNSAAVSRACQAFPQMKRNQVRWTCHSVELQG